MDLPPENDRTVRAMTDDGAFRVVTINSSKMVSSVCRAQGAVNGTAKALGDLLTATVLFRETMSPNLRVQGILRDPEGLGTLVADSAPEGATRGLVQAGKAPSEQMAESALLQMMRSLPGGSVNQGIVRLDLGATISEGMMAYMRDSEQVDTMLAVGTVLSNQGEVLFAGGYMVQLLPEVGRSPLAIMAQRLEDFPKIDDLLKDENFSPEWLRDELLYGMPFAALDTTLVTFSCWCSEDRLLGAIATLDRSEIQSMVDDGNPVEITCDYCLKEYAIQPARLSGLLRAN